MNKIFKVVWSKVKHCYVVVSEIAKNTTSGGARRCRMGKVSLAAAMAAAVLTGSFAMPNEVRAAEIAPATMQNYIAIKGVDSVGDATSIYEKYEIDQFGNYIIDRNSILSVGSTKEIDGYNYILRKIDSPNNDGYYWVREGYDIKIINNDKYFLGAQVNYKVSPYATVSNPSSDNLAFAARNGIVDTEDKTAVNNDILHKLTYTNYVAGTNGGIDVPEGWNYYIYRDDQNGDKIAVDVGTNLTANFKEVTYNSTTGHYQFNGEDVQFENVYAITLYKRDASGNIKYNYENNPILDDKVTVGVFLTSQGEVYTGPVYGRNNEILVTAYDSQSKTWSTVWGVEMPDPNASIASMTVGQFQDVLDDIHAEDVILSNADIEKTVVNGTNGNGTINLQNKKGNVVPGIEISRSAVQGQNTVITISDADDGTISLETGSRVVANGGETYDSTNNTLETISINGNEYRIAAGGGTGTMSSWTAKVGKDKAIIGNGVELEFKGAGDASVSLNGNTITISATDTNRYTTGVTAVKSGKTITTSYSQEGNNATNFDGINFKEGSNVTLGLEGRTITVNATDTKVVSGSVVEGSSGLYNIDLQTNASTNNNITIRNLHDYYTTKATASNVGTNGANVHFDRNDDTDGYDLTFVGNGSASVSVDDKGRVVINADDKDTLTNLVAGNNVSFATNDPVIDENGNRTYTINATNTYTVGTSISGNDLVFNRNDDDSFAVNFIAGGGAYNKTKSKYEDTYVQIGGENGIKLNTGSLVRGEGQVVAGSSENKSLSKITINGEVFNVPLVVPNATAGENGETTYTLEYLNINGTNYKVAQSIQGEGHDWGLTGEVGKDNEKDNSGTPVGTQSTSYTVSGGGEVKLNMLNRTTGEVQEDQIVIKDVASKAVVDEILKVKFGVTSNSNGSNKVGLYKPDANGGVHTVLSDIAVSSIVDNEGNDVQIQFGDATSGFAVNAGSKVVANGGNYNNGSNVLTKLEVNGRPYDIVNTYTTGANVNASNNIATVGFVRNDTADGDNAYAIKFEAGSNVTIGNNGNDTITISVADSAFASKNNLTVAEKEGEGKQGVWTITDSSVTDGSKQSVFENTVLGDVTFTTDDTGYGKNYVITDTAGNSITLTDVASASKLKDVAGDVTNLNNSVTNILQGDAIEFGVTSNSNGSNKVGLYKPDANGGVHTVLSDIAVSSIVDNEGNDVQIQFGDATSGFAVNAGSKVVANGGEYIDDASNVLTRLEVNGRPYDIVNTYTTGANVSASNNIATVGFVRNDTADGDSDNAYAIKFEAGSNVTIGNKGNDTITISVADSAFASKNNLTVAEKEVEGKQGIWTITDSSVTDGSKKSVFENTVLGDVTFTTDDTGYGKNYVITDTAGNSVTLTDVASASKLSEVDKKVTNIQSDITTIKGDITNIQGNITDIQGDITNINNRIDTLETSSVINDYEIGYKYKDEQGKQIDAKGTLVLQHTDAQGNTNDIISIEGLQDTTLVAGDVAANETEFGRDYSFKDTKGNVVTLKDVASANTLKTVKEQVDKNTETLKEHTTTIESHTNTLKEHSEKIETNTKSIEKERLERIDMDKAIINQVGAIDSKLNKVNSRVDKVGAGAAALAALHPMDFDPDDKLSFSAGVGNYAGQTATALGAFYRPNEKVMMSIGGTYGNNENMVNMGVSFALDRTNNISNSRTAMAREIVDLREQVATQGQQIAQLVALVNQLAGVKEPVAPTVQPFPDVPANHWAYEYLNNLVAMGVIEGYPDGTFGGDRTMTRYEFATMLFKAMQNGAVLSEQIRQEFNAELGRIRVDRIKGADDDANKIERVRVNNYEDRDDYGSKIVMVSAGK